MTVITSPAAVDTVKLEPQDLISGPCALPDAPMAMPVQVLEREGAGFWHALLAVLPQPMRAHGRS
ncbi:hypothetical protein [Thioclava sp. GXIMD4216]|uniref:Uncharacterized protein n=1 Tax=Thioclava litoralis TaxID=3076557 RepID=A0ABZ1E3Q5_9RHOB|nr:hypothetical protein RPE78_04735 [Thioclava sp. FTW29]